MVEGPHERGRGSAARSCAAQTQSHRFFRRQALGGSTSGGRFECTSGHFDRCGRLDWCVAGRALDAAGQKGHDAGRRGNGWNDARGVWGDGKRGIDRQRDGDAARRARRTGMRVAAFAGATIVIGCLRQRSVGCRFVREQIMPGIPKRWLGGIRDGALYRDGRERLSRQAQREQYDDQEFAPIRHVSTPVRAQFEGQDLDRG